MPPTLSAELPTIVRQRLSNLKTFVAETVTETGVRGCRLVSGVAGSMSSSVPDLSVPSLSSLPVPSLPSVSVPSLPSLPVPSLPSVSVPSLSSLPSWDGSSLVTTAAACVAGVAAVTERFGPMRKGAWDLD